MDKFVTLCWECRTIFRDHYRVDVCDDDVKPEAKGRPGKKAVRCENCGEKYSLRVCRIRPLPEEERGKL